MNQREDWQRKVVEMLKETGVSKKKHEEMVQLVYDATHEIAQDDLSSFVNDYLDMMARDPDVFQDYVEGILKSLESYA